MRNVEIYGTARQTTDDIIIWRKHFAVLLNKSTGTYRKMVSRKLLEVNLYVHYWSC